jgi:hypothetical protein
VAPRHTHQGDQPPRRSRPTPRHHVAAPATRGCTELHRARHTGATLSPRLQPAVHHRRPSHTAPDIPHRQRPALRRSFKGKAGSGPKGAGSAPLRCRCCHGRRGRSTPPSSPFLPPGGCRCRPENSPAVTVMEAHTRAPVGPSGGGRGGKRWGAQRRGGARSPPASLRRGPFISPHCHLCTGLYVIMKTKQKPVCVLCRGRKLKFPLSKKMWWRNLSCGKLPCCKDHFPFWLQHLELCSELVDK